MDVHEEAKSIYNLSRRITKNTRDIELTRNNLTNVVSNDAKLNFQFTYSQVQYHLWVVLAIAYVIVSAVLLYFKKFKIFYITSGVMYLLILISAIIYLFKKI